MCMHVLSLICSVQLFAISHVQLFATLWTVSSVYKILNARILEWVAVPSSRGSSEPRDRTHVSPHLPALADGFFTTSANWEAQHSTRVKGAKLLSRVQLFATSWTVACQAPLSMEFSWPEYWSALLCPPPGDLPDPGIKPTSLTSPALAGRFFTTSAIWEAHNLTIFSE